MKFIPLNTTTIALIIFAIFSLQKMDAITDGAVTIMDLKDGSYTTILKGIHFDYSDRKETDKQRQQLAKIAHCLKAAVIAEDAWSYTGDDARLTAYVKELNQKQGSFFPPFKITLKNDTRGLQDGLCVDCMSGLLAPCKQLGVPTFNAEWRFYKDASATGHKISGKEAWESFHKKIEEILSYDDGEQLNSQYIWDINTLLYENEDLIALMRFNKDSLQALIAKSPRQLQAKLCFFGNELVEAQILHGWHLFKNHKHRIIVAGGSHSDKVEKILRTQGKVIGEVASKTVIEGDNYTIEPIDIPAYFEQLNKIIK